MKIHSGLKTAAPQPRCMANKKETTQRKEKKKKPIYLLYTEALCRRPHDRSGLTAVPYSFTVLQTRRKTDCHVRIRTAAETFFRLRSKISFTIRELRGKTAFFFRLVISVAR